MDARPFSTRLNEPMSVAHAMVPPFLPATEGPLCPAKH
jgi:hypothetical protein